MFVEMQPKFSSSQTLRVLARAFDAQAVRSDFTIDDITDVAERLGLSRAAIIQAVSRETPDTLARTLFLGTQTSFTFRAVLDKPIAAAEFSNIVARAGRHGGEFRERSGDLEWCQQGRREWLHVTIADGRTLEISAQRSVSLGLLQWFGPSAGVLTLAAAYSVFAAGVSSPSVGLILTAAVFGLAIARGAWMKIIEQWQADVATFATELEYQLIASGSRYKSGARCHSDVFLPSNTMATPTAPPPSSRPVSGCDCRPRSRTHEAIDRPFV